jgi:multiple sugar transport system substrate-binding protein
VGEASQDFQNGRIAMAIDGEWRTAFIANGTPDLNYDTAPFPVPDDQADSYGIGRVGGTIIGIPRGSANPEAAWQLVSFMATDTASLVAAANAIGNVPTTYAALESPDLDLPEQFQTFLDIFGNPGSHYKDMSIIGSADQNLLGDFAEDWQAGDVADLQAGLQQVAQQIDDAIAAA